MCVPLYQAAAIIKLQARSTGIMSAVASKSPFIILNTPFPICKICKLKQLSLACQYMYKTLNTKRCKFSLEQPIVVLWLKAQVFILSTHFRKQGFGADAIALKMS